jgi:HEPN domain-containing protein
MPPDAQAEEIAAWLSRAGQDLRAAAVGLAATPPLLADAAFHCQQAVEKVLKAFLTRHDHPFRKTHDIGELGVACVAYDPSIEDLVRPAAPFTEYAWRFRYPGDVFEPDRAEVEEALDLARAIVDAITAIVG